MRPASIVTFERCYLASLVVSIADTLAFWPSAIGAMRANPAVAKMGPGFAAGVLGGGLAISAAVTLLLWYLAAHRHSAAAKWVVTIFFAFGLVSLLRGIAAGTHPFGVQGIVGIASVVLNAVAVWMLFRPDARAWFAEGALATGAVA